MFGLVRHIRLIAHNHILINNRSVDAAISLKPSHKAASLLKVNWRQHCRLCVDDALDFSSFKLQQKSSEYWTTLLLLWPTMIITHVRVQLKNFLLSFAFSPLRSRLRAITSSHRHPGITEAAPDENNIANFSYQTQCLGDSQACMGAGKW